MDVVAEEAVVIIFFKAKLRGRSIASVGSARIASY